MKLKQDLLQDSEVSASEIFRNDILTGLRSQPKKLSSKYFYDKHGDRLFQEIMAMPEYYLTPCELDIFQNKTSEIIRLIAPENEPFDLIELGAGDAMKSTFLLEKLLKENKEFSYMPIDISGNILSVLHETLSEKLPQLDIQLLEGDYFEMLKKAEAVSSRRKVVLFLGGNIGNMEPQEALDFCKAIYGSLSKGDMLLVGFDLKKNPRIILDAYNDAAGITASFNLNLLKRINRELYADFDVNHYEHYQTYNPVDGACRSYLVSLYEQQIMIDGEVIDFEENELIHMEISQKFSHKEVLELAKNSGFKVLGEISDSKNWFIDSVWKV
ncbi:dimethylhistidine N-methyltransferase [Chryseobacterium sp. Leaf180]|uniref:L-histidine N(alpha)-methyltransferase n=1 Tax=Chryseobacterium sp. Leaf180 TaxID=1736289 RepID=UPI0006F8C509|nr:L-histidine N(alpha)-methyltransferase [Chryseobacterium sp. Leaf180]KQR91084.1 dimethylhistidine N-methyltransferase [Chryseobacterium sp. Leaf180]